MACGSPSPPAFASYDPRYVFLENVAALRTRGLGKVLADLAALGYDTQWLCLRAADTGACHRRDRIFILACQPGRRGRACGCCPPRSPGRSTTGNPVESWLARRDRQKKLGRNGNGIGTPLAIAIRLLPTPMASDSAAERPRSWAGSGPRAPNGRSACPR